MKIIGKVILIICMFCFVPRIVFADDCLQNDLLEKDSKDNMEKMNEILNIYNKLYFDNLMEEELKENQDFQRSVHLLNELYFEYGSLEDIPMLPFDVINIRKGDMIFTEVVSVIAINSDEILCVTEYDEISLLQKCLQKLNYYSGGIVSEENENIKIAIKQFQQDNELTVDGVAGEEVWRKIDVLLQGKQLED